MTATTGQCFKLIGCPAEFGRETGWRSLITASLMLMHLATPGTISRGTPSRRRRRTPSAEYKDAAAELRGSLTPLVCSTDAVLHREYTAYQRRLASQLAGKWEKPLSLMVSWVRVRTQFAIFRAVDLRLRSSRRRLMGLTVHDGAGVGIGH